MLPDLVSLALFVRAVDAKSLSKAADLSHIALAAASRRIALLEHRYGVKLLYRSLPGPGEALNVAGLRATSPLRRGFSWADRVQRRRCVLNSRVDTETPDRSGYCRPALHG